MDNLRNYRAEIEDLINSDVILRHNYYEGVVEYNLRSDSAVIKAVELLRDPERYNKILNEQDTQRN
jgi:carboxyl-terminal processing protease